MRPEWVEYWKEFNKRSLTSLGWAVLISLIFFGMRFPFLKQDQVLLSLKISLIYGACIGFFVIAVYSLFWAIRVHRQIIGYVDKEPGNVTNSLLGFFASGVGVILATYIISKYILKTDLSFSSIWFSTIMGCFISLLFVFYYSYKNSEKDNSELRAAKAEAELHVLKNQMQPHFLFNSLNSLLELVETNSTDAPLMTMKLSDLYREILENSKKNFSSLESELSIIKKYLILEKLRFGERLSYKILAPEGENKIMLPPLILQTLVENAIKHGIGSEVNGGEVTIKITEQTKGYELKVKSPGRFIEPDKNNERTGLQNTVSRLKLAYGDAHNFKIKNIEDGVLTSFWFSGVESAC